MKNCNNLLYLKISTLLLYRFIYRVLNRRKRSDFDTLWHHASQFVYTTNLELYLLPKHCIYQTCNR